MNDERLKSALAKGFSAEQAEQLLNFSKIMAGKVVKDFLIKFVTSSAPANLKDKSDPKVALYKRLLAKVNRIDCGRDPRGKEFSGYQEITFEDRDHNDHTMRFQLSIVPSDYNIELKVPPIANPEPLIKNLFSSMDKFCDMAIQYYDMAVRVDGLLADLSEFFPNIDVGKFQINKNTRSLYFDEEYSDRIGILIFYVDGDGKPLT